MKSTRSKILRSACLLALANVAYGQSATTAPRANQPSADVLIDEIIVTARRRDERLEDVPSTINVATAEQLSDLNIRNFTDVATLMPGLNLFGTNVVNATASVRGITFNQVVSGNNGVIEFYLNDSPVPSSLLYQQMYDIGQIELLRGPQGTLRGRASPAGSMTVTTRRPDLSEVGGYVNATATDIGGKNINAAVNIPLVNDKLALRLSALWDENEGDRVRSVNNARKPLSRTQSARATLRFEPTDYLSFLFTYQELKGNRHSYLQVENVNVATPGTPLAVVPANIPGSPSNFPIRAEDRLSVQDTPTDPENRTDIANLQAEWAFLGQKLNYVGSSNYTALDSTDVLDTADFFGPTNPSVLQGYARKTLGTVNGQAHELRLSSEEQIFGMFDYLVGAFYEQQRSPTNFSNLTFAATSPNTATVLATTILSRLNFTREQSYFGNLTMHLGTGTEISGGVRRIDFAADSGLIQNGTPNPALDVHDRDSTTVYQGSVKQKFSDDLMVYFTVGTSWRPSVTVVGDFNLRPSPREVSFLHLAPEESTSYELGVKASTEDKRLRGTLAVYRQKYKNNPWRSPTPVYFANTSANASGVLLPPAPVAFNLAAAVPVTIEGIEGELAYAPFKWWDMSVNASYAKGDIDNGFVPCNDYIPPDGIPDTGTTAPTIAQINAGAGPGETVAGCRVNYRASQSPKLSGTLQTEFHTSIASRFDGYARGLLSRYGSTENDPTNPIDNIDSYSLLNLYLGIRSSNGTWDVGLYGKNVTDEDTVLSRTQVALGGSVRAAPTFAAVNYSTNYRSVSVTAPREFGINVRYAFGSR